MANKNRNGSIKIEIEGQEAFEFMAMLNAMQQEKIPSHPLFQAMIITLFDKIQNAAIDQLTLEQINKYTQ